MPVEEVLEVTNMEEATTVEETAAPVDLTTVSQQLDQVLAWQGAQFGMLAVIFGCVLGVAFGKIIGRFWK